MEDQTQDATTQVETTTEASSAETQTQETSQEPLQTQDASTEAEQTVPYARFKEVNDKYKELEKRYQDQGNQTPRQTQPNPQADVIKQQLKELGFVSREEIEQQKADEQLENSLKSLEKAYDGKDGRPKFNRQKVLEYASQNLIGNPEVAYKTMHEAELMDFAIKQATGKTKGVKSEVSDGSGSANMGTSNDDLMSAYQQGDSSAMRTLVRRAIS